MPGSIDLAGNLRTFLCPRTSPFLSSAGRTAAEAWAHGKHTFLYGRQCFC